MRYLFLVFLFFSLNSYSQDLQTKLLGDWGFFAEPLTNFNSKDSTYKEISFESDMYSVNDRVIGISLPIYYEVNGDSLFTIPQTEMDSLFAVRFHIKVIDDNRIRLENETNKYLLFKLDSTDFTISKMFYEDAKFYNLSKSHNELYLSISSTIHSYYEMNLRQRELKFRIETNKISIKEAIKKIDSILLDNSYEEEFEFFRDLKIELMMK